MKVLIKGGRVIDPLNRKDEVLDILIDGANISKVTKNLIDKTENTIDAKGKIVLPGLIDMHVHLREPGREDKETIASGTQAAIHGGVTALLAMPNTEPAIDSPQQVRLLRQIIERDARADTFIAATITKSRLGEELTDIAALKKEGAIAITDDGSSVDNEKVMLKAFQIARQENILVVCHCEDKALSAKGVVNWGFTATRMGLRGIPKESEYQRVARDLKLAAQAKARVHIAHVSCRESVELIAEAKKKGLAVTAETAPHYFSLSEEAVLGFDTNTKMNPPLRGEEDLVTIKQGLRDGIIDAIACDHAPHTESEKDIEFERAEFGVIGLETSLAVAITYLINPGLITWIRLAELMSVAPAKILGIDKGTLSPGKSADIIIVSPDKEWVVQKNNCFSKSKNSPFLGKKLKGVIEYTIYKGQIVHKA